MLLLSVILLLAAIKYGNNTCSRNLHLFVPILHFLMFRFKKRQVLIKLFIIFIVLKIFFFPNFLKEHAQKGEESDFVATEMIDRAK